MQPSVPSGGRFLRCSYSMVSSTGSSWKMREIAFCFAPPDNEAMKLEVGVCFLRVDDSRYEEECPLGLLESRTSLILSKPSRSDDQQLSRPWTRPRRSGEDQVVDLNVVGPILMTRPIRCSSRIPWHVVLDNVTEWKVESFSRFVDIITCASLRRRSGLSGVLPCSSSR